MDMQNFKEVPWYRIRKWNGEKTFDEKRWIEIVAEYHSFYHQDTKEKFLVRACKNRLIIPHNLNNKDDSKDENNSKGGMTLKS